MKNNFHSLFALLSVFFLLSFVSGEKKNSVKDFHLLNVDGKMVSLSDYSDAQGFIIVFTCNHCPFAKLYPERLNNLNNKYQPLGVPLIAISSTDTVIFEEDSYIKMIEKATSENFNYPYLFDEFQTVAKDFGAQKTPHAFVIWKVNNQYTIKYDGAIDDNGAEPEKVKHSFVNDAVDALLKGEEIKITTTGSIGCQIKFRK